MYGVYLRLHPRENDDDELKRPPKDEPKMKQAMKRRRIDKEMAAKIWRNCEIRLTFD